MAASTIVDLAQGRLRGAEIDGCHVWRGVPFAAPPVGDLRWRAPRSPVPWRGTRTVVDPVPQAVQMSIRSSSAATAWSSEDCLTLNVCAPLGTPPEGGWPVLFYLHSGGNLMGSEDQFGLGDAFAREGILVVKPQYRLGALGFLNLAFLNPDSESESGSCGLLDQLAALFWTSRNIAAFGGNPDRLTIYGESAGGMAVGTLLGTPAAAGSFSQAIVSSGGANQLAHEAATADAARVFLARLGTRDPSVARSATAEEILTAQESVLPGLRQLWLWRPTRSRRLHPRTPLTEIRTGGAKGVRLLVGNNADEAALFSLLVGRDACVAPARANLEAILGARRTDALLAEYRRSRSLAEPEEAWLAAMGDERYAMPTLRLAEAQARHSQVYRYRVDVAAPGVDERFAGSHGAELPMVWQTPDTVAAEPPSAPRQVVSRGLHHAWVRFLKGQPPTSEELTSWPCYELPDRATLVVSDAPRVIHDPRAAERRLWGVDDWEYGTWWSLGEAGTSGGRSPGRMGS